MRTAPIREPAMPRCKVPKAPLVDGTSIRKMVENSQVPSTNRAKIERLVVSFLGNRPSLRSTVSLSAGCLPGSFLFDLDRGLFSM
jgi:hypothetical protein